MPEPKIERHFNFNLKSLCLLVGVLPGPGPPTFFIVTFLPCIPSISFHEIHSNLESLPFPQGCYNIYISDRHLIAVTSNISQQTKRFTERMMESYLNENFGGVKSKNSSQEALQRWRKLCGVVKNPKRRFRFTANLNKRTEAAAMRRSNQVVVTSLPIFAFNNCELDINLNWKHPHVFNLNLNSKLFDTKHHRLTYHTKNTYKLAN